MSLSEQIQRVDGSQNDILKKVLGAFGVTVGENKIDQLAALAKAAPLLKENSLYSPETAALFGLGPDSVPDDVLAYVGKYNQHWWKRRKLNGNQIVEKTEDIDSLVEIASIEFSPQTVHWMYSDSIDINQSTGKITLKSPQYINFYAYEKSDLEFYGGQLISKKPFYFSLGGSQEKVYYIPKDGTFGENISDTITISMTSYWYLALNNYATSKAKIVTIQEIPVQPGNYEYLQSSSRSAYPDSGEQDGYEYQYLGVPFENAATAPKIATGSYVGTGKYGSSNPNSLTFEFEPKVVIISTDGRYITAIGLPYIWGSEKMYTQRSDIQQACTVSVSGNTMSYYSGSDEYTQMNTAKQKYPYIAIG